MTGTASDVIRVANRRKAARWYEPGAFDTEEGSR